MKVRVRACGICGSDVHGYLDITGRRTAPIIMGHEFAGEVAALGQGADQLNSIGVSREVAEIIKGYGKHNKERLYLWNNL